MFKRDNKPLGSVCVYGSQQDGKTETAKQLAEQLGVKSDHTPNNEEKHAVAKLIGPIPGYVGFEETGLLVTKLQEYSNRVAIRRSRKAHRCFQILLQIMMVPYKETMAKQQAKICLILTTHLEMITDKMNDPTQ